MDQNLKNKLISKNQKHKQDSGSDQVQIALLTEEIKILSQHLKNNVKDIVARRILLKKVAKQKKLVKFNAISH